MFLADKEIDGFAMFDTEWGIVDGTIASTPRESIWLLNRLSQDDLVRHMERMMLGKLRVHAVRINVGEPQGEI